MSLSKPGIARRSTGHLVNNRYIRKIPPVVISSYNWLKDLSQHMTDWERAVVKPPVDELRLCLNYLSNMTIVHVIMDANRRIHFLLDGTNEPAPIELRNHAVSTLIALDAGLCYIASSLGQEVSGICRVEVFDHKRIVPKLQTKVRRGHWRFYKNKEDPRWIKWRVIQIVVLKL